MYFSISYYKPVLLRTIRTFRAPNPWNRGEITGWSLNEYALAAVGSVMGQKLDGKPSRFQKTLSLGIQSEPDGRYHILPRSLAALSRSQRVPDDQLPALLREMEPTLEGVDFKHPTDWWFFFMGVLMTAATLAIVGTWVLLSAGQMGSGGFKVMLLFGVFFGFMAAAGIRRMLLPSLRRKRQEEEALRRKLPSWGASGPR